ncbi:MAG: hypothetical protein ACKPKO_30280, partial [Candidatus Fonsibacter sp.]
LSVGGTFVSASVKRLKFNEKPLTNALEVISILEPVVYDQTQDLVDQFYSRYSAVSLMRFHSSVGAVNRRA